MDLNQSQLKKFAAERASTSSSQADATTRAFSQQGPEFFRGETPVGAKSAEIAGLHRRSSICPEVQNRLAVLH